MRLLSIYVGGSPFYTSRWPTPYIFLLWSLVEEEVFWLGQSARSTLAVRSVEAVADWASG